MRILESLPIAMFMAFGAACGGSPPNSKSTTSLQVVLNTDAPFATHADFQSRLASTIQLALDYWGGDWSDLDGVTLTISDDPTVTCLGTQALGCFDGNIRMTTRDRSDGTFSCVEETVLVHEIGHAVIGDADHTDPRWMEMDALSEQLSNRPGYTSDGETSCPIYLSVWRHPLGTP